MLFIIQLHPMKVFLKTLQYLSVKKEKQQTVVQWVVLVIHRKQNVDPRFNIFKHEQKRFKILKSQSKVSNISRTSQSQISSLWDRNGKNA